MNKNVDKPKGYEISKISDEVILNFKINKKNNKGKIEECFSEIEVINFVANSYKNSCLKLLQEMKKYRTQNDWESTQNFIYNYLPAMFDFRHYLELKMKLLYMDWHNESFHKEHKLSDLLANLEKVTKQSFLIFREPINYIENIEKSLNGLPCVEYFRYLIDKDFNSVKQLKIPMFEFDNIFNYIYQIELQTLNAKINSMSNN